MVSMSGSEVGFPWGMLPVIEFDGRCAGGASSVIEAG
jgi:hypothetical protein